MIRWLASLLIALGLAGAATAQTADPSPEPPLRVLYLSQSVGFTHGTVRRPPGGLAPSEWAMEAMAYDSGAFTVERVQNAAYITPEMLEDLDVLVFSTTGALHIRRETWDAIQAWIESGRGGFVGIHSATDTALDFEGGAEAYRDFIGGVFDGHPWTQGTPIRLANLEPDHPLAAMWPDGTDYAEEIYQYAGFDPDRVRVLQTLDMDAGPLRRPYPVPVTWVRQIGQGRLFYTNLGHTPSTWDDPRFRAQIVAAIRWAGHRLDAPAEPNRPAQDRAALAAFAAEQGLDIPSLPVPALADAIRGLQPLHPEKHEGDATAWNAAIARVRARADPALFQPLAWAEAPEAEWPRAAWEASIEGSATLACMVNEQGQAQGCQVLSETPEGSGFGDAALAASPGFRWRPAAYDGQNFETEATFQVNFRFGETVKAPPEMETVMNSIASDGYVTGLCRSHLDPAIGQHWDAMATTIDEHPTAHYRPYDQVFILGYVKGNQDALAHGAPPPSRCAEMRRWADQLRKDAEPALVKLDAQTPPSERRQYRPSAE